MLLPLFSLSWCALLIIDDGRPYIRLCLVFRVQLVTLEFKSKVTSALEGGESSLVSATACMSAADVIGKHSGKNGCIAFAVRRPGETNCTFTTYMCCHGQFPYVYQD